MRRLTDISGFTVMLFLVWKVALLVFTAQPVPGNDSFFYDGPVVNYVLHGKYCNPSLAGVLPISGREVFSAYPPLYQAVLLGWMKCFGVSALATMWFHTSLLGLFALTLLRIFRHLKVPPNAANLAGLFLFGLTFHDRPDTLAHVLGALAILALVRGLFWAAAVLLLLTFATSLQIGGIYSCWLALLTVGGVWLGKYKFPWAPAVAFSAMFLGLIALVKFGYPQWWAGFREHVQITPSFTGLRLPRADDLLKIIRSAPGILLVLAALAWLGVKRINFREQLARSPQLFVAAFGAFTALALMGGCLFILTANTIHIASYLQPLIVGGFLAAFAVGVGGLKLGRTTTALFVAAALLVSVRAIGMTTWGWWCARDVSYSEAIARVNEELDSVPPGETVFASSAYLYEVAQRTNVIWLHSDWPTAAAPYDGGLSALSELRPAKLLVTQFDYYRRFEPVVAQFRRERGDVAVRITSLARVQPPDAIPATRKIVQHVSWAPVIIEFSWPAAVEFQ